MDAVILAKILERLEQIENKVNQIANPMAHVSTKEKGKVMREAMLSGDKAKIKAAKLFVNNGRSLQ